MVLNAEKLATKIEGIHAFVAGLTGLPILRLMPAEALQIAEASVEVAQFYELPVNGKTLAWINLAAVLGMVYGIRVVQWQSFKAHMLSEKFKQESESVDMSDPFEVGQHGQNQGPENGPLN